MAAKFLSSSGPTEILVMIFQACYSIKDVLFLGAACRRLRGVLLGNASTILRGVGADNIVCFYEALLAVRATQICLDAEHQGKLPPADLQLDALSARPLSLEEFLRVLDLNHCVHALETALRQLETDGSGQFHEQVPQQPEDSPAWGPRLRKAIYRSFVLGAALSRAYREPFFADEEEKWLAIEEDRGGVSREEEFQYLEGFAAYCMQPTPEAERATFGPFADWLAREILADGAGRRELASRFEEREGRAECCVDYCGSDARGLRDGDDSCPLRDMETCQHSDSHFMVWEVMQVLWASCHIQAWEHYGIINRQADNIAPRQFGPQEAANLQDYPGKARAVLFGHFRPEELRTPRVIVRGQRPKILAHPTLHNWRPAPGDNPQGKTSYNDAYFSDFLGCRILEDIFNKSGKPNAIVDEDGVAWQLPPLALRFFEYVLRCDFQVRFRDDSFHEPDPGSETENRLTYFLSTAAMFSNDEPGYCYYYNDEYADGSLVLVAIDPSQELTYKKWNIY